MFDTPSGGRYLTTECGTHIEVVQYIQSACPIMLIFLCWIHSELFGRDCVRIPRNTLHIPNSDFSFASVFFLLYIAAPLIVGPLMCDV